MLSHLALVKVRFSDIQQKCHNAKLLTVAAHIAESYPNCRGVY